SACASLRAGAPGPSRSRDRRCSSCSSLASSSSRSRLSRSRSSWIHRVSPAGWAGGAACGATGGLSTVATLGTGTSGATAACGATGLGAGAAAAAGALGGGDTGTAAWPLLANSCCAALNTCRQAPQRTAPWATANWARLTRKLVWQCGHWVTKLSVMRRSGRNERLFYSICWLSAAHAADADPAVLLRCGVEIEGVGVGGAHFLGLLGKDAGQRQ